MIKHFTDMSVWQKAHSLAIEVFQISSVLPGSEDNGLTSQIRRSSNGIPGNIAEAFGRSTNKDKANFYIIGRGSAYETQNHLIYGFKVKYFDEKTTSNLMNRYGELILELNKIIKSLKG
ncbi:MAG: four helix bundle protein [Bacteroidota bacterium]